MDNACLKEALRLLELKARGTEELRQKLTSKGYSPESVDPVLEFLSSRRYLDDQRTIQETIAAKSGRRAVGRTKLRDDMIARGLSEEQIEAELGQAPSELERAREVLLTNPKADRGKAGRFLMSRGFDEETVESALDSVFGSE